MPMRPLLLFVLLSVSACASVRPSPSTPEAARRAYDGRRATVVLADGSVHHAAALQVGPTETSWVDARQFVAVPTCALAELRAEAPRQNIRGALVLGGASVGVGALAGGLLCGLDGEAEAVCVVGAAAAFGAIGALTGAALEVARRPRVPPPAGFVPTCPAVTERRPLG